MYIEVTFPDSSVQKFTVKQNSAILGRSKKADIAIEIEGISRQHLKIDYENDTFYVTDLKSTNGIYLNNEKIPADKKVKYLSILPMRVGPLMISIKGEQEEVVREPTSATLTMNHSSDLGNINSQRAEAKSRPRKEFSKPKSKSNSIALLLFLGVAGSAYYFYEKKQSEALENEAKALEQKAQVEKSKPIVINLLDSRELKKLLDSSNCANPEVQSICKIINRDLTKYEGVVKSQDTLVIFFNVKTLDKYLVGDDFKKLDEKKRYQALLINEFLIPSLVKEAQKLNVKLVQAVAFTDDQDILSIKASAGIPTQNDLKIDDLNFRSIMSYILQRGKYKLFDQYLAKYITLD